MFSVSHDADTNANGISCLQCQRHLVILMPMASHEQKHHVAPHFSCFNVKNAMVPLMMPLALCDSNASAKASNYQRSCLIPFGLPWHKECHGAFLVPLVSCDAKTSANGITWQKRSYFTHLILIILRQQMQLCHWQCYWHHMILMLVPVASNDGTSPVTSSFDDLYITNGMVPLVTVLA